MFVVFIPSGKSFEYSKTFPACVMDFRDESKTSMAAKILQWVGEILKVLSLDLCGELNSTSAGVVYLVFINFIFNSCLIMRSLMSLLYGLVGGRVSSEFIVSLAGSSLDRCIVSPSFSGVVWYLRCVNVIF